MMKRTAFIAFFISFLLAVGNAGADWTTLDYPGKLSTEAYGIDGDRIVGRSTPGHESDSDGFVYTISTGSWQHVHGRLDSTYSTCIYGISGDVVVGRWIEPSGTHTSGFSLNLSSGVRQGFGNEVIPIGYDGSSFVGRLFYPGSGQWEGFFFNKPTLYYFSGPYPGSTYTAFTDVDGSRLVGSYNGENGLSHGFLIDWTDEDGVPFELDYPYGFNTTAFGIDGSNVTGSYKDGASYHGFLYNHDLATWETIDYPGAFSTWATGINSNRIVGYYQTSPGDTLHGFLYVVPEPSTLVLTGIGATVVGWLRRRRKS
jgi:hypothetical protein